MSATPDYIQVPTLAYNIQQQALLDAREQAKQFLHDHEGELQ